jgi:hypothetical protein
MSIFYCNEALKIADMCGNSYLSPVAEKLFDEACKNGNEELRFEIAEYYVRYITLEALFYDTQEMDESIIRYLSKINKYGTSKHKELVSMIFSKKASEAFLNNDCEMYEKYVLLSKKSLNDLSERLGFSFFFKGTELCEGEYDNIQKDLGLKYIRKSAEIYHYEKAITYIHENHL